MKSLIALNGADLGFRPENVLVARATGVRSLADNTRFFQEVIGRVAALPGVTAAGAVTTQKPTPMLKTWYISASLT